MELTLGEVHKICILLMRPTGLIVRVLIQDKLIIKDMDMDILHIALKTITVEYIMAIRVVARVIQPLVATLIMEHTMVVKIMVRVIQPLQAIRMVEYTKMVSDIMAMRIMVRFIQPLPKILVVEHTAAIIMRRVILNLLPLVMVKDTIAIIIMVRVMVVIHTVSSSLLFLLMGAIATEDKRAFSSKMAD